MGSISSRDLKFTREAQGLGYSFPMITTGNGSNITAAAAGSGDFTVSIRPNSIGSTMPSTLIDVIPLPSGTNPMRLSTIVGRINTTSMPLLLAYIYQFGTQVLTSTGDQFTHHAATFPVLRTQMGTSQAVPLIPMIQVTTATTTTAAVLTMKTAAGGTGYKDEENNNVVGTLTHTMPAAATAVNSCFLLPLEEGDRGVRDIVAIQTNTAASAGAATIWGIEPISFLNSTSVAHMDSMSDHFFNALTMPDLRPAAATSGTANAKLVLLSLTAISGSLVFTGYATAVADT